ncbi:MAG: GNAT family N-acetyltransferase [Pseudomonadales bacterium]|nr:GNAT family N-acetyltransferase [Pseudomonadales bacterium]
MIIIEAGDNESEEVAELVKELLVELEPGNAAAIDNMQLAQIAKSLLSSGKMWAFLVRHNDSNIAVITLHECAAIYAGGVFGEISELFVKPEYRSAKVGDLLLRSAIDKSRELGWKRLEVGSPPANESPRTIKFYENKGFKCSGLRLRYLID